MVRLHGQDTHCLTGDPIIEQYIHSGFRGIGKRGVFLCFKGGGGGGDDPSPEELQQQKDTVAKDAEYRGIRRAVADPWLKDLKKDTFNQNERAAIAAGKSGGDIEQQVAGAKDDGLQAALASGADLSTGGGRSAFTNPAGAAADAHQAAGQAAQTTGATSRMNDIMDGVRLGQDNMQVTGQNLSTMTAFGTDKVLNNLQKNVDANAEKWHAAGSAANFAAGAYGSSVDEDAAAKSAAQRGSINGPVPYKPTWGGAINRGLSTASDKLSGMFTWGGR